MPPVTRSNLKPAKITNLANNEVVYCMFNPKEYKVSKSNSWTEKAAPGMAAPYLAFETGSLATLTLKLMFDTSFQRTDVRAHTNKLRTMTQNQMDKMKPTEPKAPPPAVAFEWGRLYFKAVITSLTETLTLFDEEGLPLRADIDITLKEYVTGNAAEAVTQQAPAETQQAGTPVQIKQGDRPDLVASQNGGQPSDYRAVCEANNIDNPNSMKPGQQVVVPK